MRLLDHSLLIVLVHFWEIESLLVQVGTHDVPPGGEVLSDAPSKVRAVRRRLAHDIVECWCGPCKVRELDGDELSREESEREP